MPVIVTVDPVVFSNPVHRSQWYTIRTEVTVHAACRNPVRKAKVTVEQHRLWWEESAKSNDRMLYFIRDSNPPAPERYVGIVRLDHRGTWTEVWLAVKPEYRLQHLATRALNIVSSLAQTRRWKPLGAVLNGKKNGASWRLFVKAGFVPMKEGFAQLIQKGRTV